MKVTRLIEEGGMDKLRRLSGSKSITGDRDKDLSKGGFSRKRGGERNGMKKNNCTTDGCGISFDIVGICESWINSDG
jgi:hypothetical protein